MSYSDGHYISEDEFERYLYDNIPITGSCNESFLPFCVFTASRRFLFYLDSHRKKRIPIKRLGLSTVMEELLYLKRISQYER